MDYGDAHELYWVLLDLPELERVQQREEDASKGAMFER